MNRIIDDDRPIKSIIFEDDSVFQVDIGGIDSIVAYEENDMVTWFLIYKSGEVTQRVSGRYVAVVSYE